MYIYIYIYIYSLFKTNYNFSLHCVSRQKAIIRRVITRLMIAFWRETQCSEKL